VYVCVCVCVFVNTGCCISYECAPFSCNIYGREGGELSKENVLVDQKTTELVYCVLVKSWAGYLGLCETEGERKVFYLTSVLVANVM
jgi:hypothetical protein